jgi:hypothetical protein
VQKTFLVLLLLGLFVFLPLWAEDNQTNRVDWADERPSMKNALHSRINKDAQALTFRILGVVQENARRHQDG